MTIDEKTKGEIAYKYLKLILSGRFGGHHGGGYDLDNSFRRRVGNLAKNIGVEFPQMLEFETALVREILDDVSEPKKEPTEEELEGRFHSGGH